MGSPVEFRLLTPVLVGNGLVVPEEATLIGHVVQIATPTDHNPSSSLSVSVHTIRWGKNELPINAVVSQLYFVRSSYIAGGSAPRATFLEGIQIVSHLAAEANTEFSSTKKEVVLRSGILLLLRQIDPNDYGTVFRYQNPQLAAR